MLVPASVTKRNYLSHLHRRLKTMNILSSLGTLKLQVCSPYSLTPNLTPARLMVFIKYVNDHHPHTLPPIPPPHQSTRLRDPRWSINRRAPRLLWCTYVTACIMWRVRKIGRPLLCVRIVSRGAKCACASSLGALRYPPTVVYIYHNKMNIHV